MVTGPISVCFAASYLVISMAAIEEKEANASAANRYLVAFITIPF
jgi:hypothetical protein